MKRDQTAFSLLLGHHKQGEGGGRREEERGGGRKNVNPPGLRPVLLNPHTAECRPLWWAYRLSQNEPLADDSSSDVLLQPWDLVPGRVLSQYQPAAHSVTTCRPLHPRTFRQALPGHLIPCLCTATSVLTTRPGIILITHSHFHMTVPCQAQLRQSEETNRRLIAHMTFI